MSHTLTYPSDVRLRHGRYITEIRGGRCIHRQRRGDTRKPKQARPMSIAINPHKPAPAHRPYPYAVPCAGEFVGTVHATVLTVRCPTTLDVTVIDADTLQIGAHRYTRDSLANLRQVLAVADALMDSLGRKTA